MLAPVSVRCLREAEPKRICSKPQSELLEQIWDSLCPSLHLPEPQTSSIPQAARGDPKRRTLSPKYEVFPGLWGSLQVTNL